MKTDYHTGATRLRQYSSTQFIARPQFRRLSERIVAIAGHISGRGRSRSQTGRPRTGVGAALCRRLFIIVDGRREARHPADANGAKRADWPPGHAAEVAREPR